MKQKIFVLILTCIFISICFSSLTAGKISETNIFLKNNNDPPVKPMTPFMDDGMDATKPLCRNNYYGFYTHSSDPNHDDIIFGWDWDGDLNVDEWGGYRESTLWNESGTYHIRVKAKDEHGLESEWSDLLNVYVSQNHGPFVVDFLGPIRVKTGEKPEKDYFLCAEDPEKEGVYTYFDWGDGTNTGWLNKNVRNASHIWVEKGEYVIKAKAKDIYGEETGWYYLRVDVVRFKAKDLFNFLCENSFLKFIFENHLHRIFS